MNHILHYIAYVIEAIELAEKFNLTAPEYFGFTVSEVKMLQIESQADECGIKLNEVQGGREVVLTGGQTVFFALPVVDPMQN